MKIREKPQKRKKSLIHTSFSTDNKDLMMDDEHGWSQQLSSG